MANDNQTPADAAGTQAELRGATEFLVGFKRVEQEIQTLPERELSVPNLDVTTMVATVLGSLPEITALRAQVAKLPELDLAQFDKLRDYAFALAHAQAAFRAATGPTDAIGRLAEEAITVRDQLHTDALALAKRGLLQDERVAKLRSGLGHKSVAIDVVGLVQLFRERFAALQGRMAVTEAELDRAAQLGQELMTAAGVKEQAHMGVSAATLLRHRAFTLCARAYDQARRAVIYLRWDEGDADQIAPSLWAGRGGRRASEEAPRDRFEPAADPIAVSNPVAAAQPKTTTVGVGLPGAMPFAG